MLDDLQTEYYDSSLKRTESRQQWMTAGVPEVYWLEQTKVADTIQTHIFRKIAPFVTMFGIRYIQGVLGCTLENDQSTKIFIKININGFGDIECDMVTVHCWGTGVLTFLTAEFEDIIKDLTFIKLLNTSCVEGLYTTFRAGKTALQRKVAPQVLVFSLNSSAEMSTPLLCLITAFYPRAIDAMWLHNGVPVTDDLTVTVLPNHDATYRMEILIDIKNNDPSGYSCQVQHRSLSETLTVMSDLGKLLSPLEAVQFTVPQIGTKGNAAKMKKQGALIMLAKSNALWFGLSRSCQSQDLAWPSVVPIHHVGNGGRRGVVDKCSEECGKGASSSE
ncbi:hypothetical protein chiPu_0020673 [Chiloscyllium punctatum]|uniref:Ig-like domain-containing protein n=1 Tax=Chiloscyllium punctatum TaxID=137246 RepID=A0A401RI86_CHIPU|nr:hypothetical protein [Chiloscyllium punctatum]